jgi:hypothetical protein
VTWVVLRLLEVGTPDEWGDYWVAGWAGIATGSVILSGGMVGLGRWLATESPVGEQPAHPVAAA